MYGKAKNPSYFIGEKNQKIFKNKS
jgi:hypothetical protein